MVTIWGYEEPENNLETRKCFELAEFFIANSKPVQTGQSNALKPMLDKTNTAADIEAMAQTLQTKGVVQVEVVTYLK